MKTGYGRDICIPIFIAVLFTIVKLWKQPKCPSAGRKKDKEDVVYIHKGVLFSHDKKETLPFVTT